MPASDLPKAVKAIMAAGYGRFVGKGWAVGIESIAVFTIAFMRSLFPIIDVAKSRNSSTDICRTSSEKESMMAGEKEESPGFVQILHFIDPLQADFRSLGQYH